jgi:outer membrane receptor protein involved in Fe transport
LKNQTNRGRLFGSSVAFGAITALAASSSFAQDSREAVSAEEEIVITGSRIVRPDFVATSPLVSVTQEEVVGNADITLETYLNTLPQVNPGGTTTSNNPGFAGQAGVDLRGLGVNRNVVLVDGRRPMVSSNGLFIDLNTIPAAMIDRIEVVTGGAGAAYGADAVSGAVNVRLKDDFEGADFRANYSNSTEFEDAKEYNFSAVIGGNFADGRGNAIFGFDRSYREPIAKGQRAFSALATATTGTPPEGAIIWATTNPVPEAAVDALFATYGVGAADVTATSGRFGFNQDGSLIFYGRAADPDTVQNWRDPVTLAQNPRFFPDFYSYNFDAVNALVLPLDRYSFLFDVDYETEAGPTFFAQAGWTEYTADTLLAPTPLPGVRQTSPLETDPDMIENATFQVENPFLDTLANCLAHPNGSTVRCGTQLNLFVPVTNPFIPADLHTLLAARTGDDPIVLGSGATEPFRFAFRPLGFGARKSLFNNTVVQFLGGVRGDLGDTGWTYEAYLSEGRTQIDITQFGNIDTQKLQDVLNDPIGTPCAAYNPFGNNTLAAECKQFLESPVSRRQDFTMRVGQAFVRGDLFELPAGAVSAVLGVEYRSFEYSDRFLSQAGPFSGFNVSDPEAGESEFFDMFGEALIPLVADAPLIQSLDLNLGYRRSQFSFVQLLPTPDESSEQASDAYKAELNWEVNDWLRGRFSFQRSVRAPNFGELFAGSVSFPQIHDPCNNYSAARNGPNAAQLAALCIATGVPAANIATFAATPGGQAQIVLAGNTDLEPETGETITAGLVVTSPFESQWLSRLSGSIDYYKIEITDPILSIDTNVAIASCYNYYGTNPNYTVADTVFCQGLLRQGAGNTINAIDNPLDPAGEFPGVNGGVQRTEGIDIALVYGFDLGWMGMPDNWGSIDLSLLATRVLKFEQADADDLPALDYVGTIAFFGAGLGQSFPEWKATIGMDYEVGPFGIEYRARYIDSMINRMKVIYPGETQFGTSSPADVPAYWYHDIAATWDLTGRAQLRIGVNNVADEQPAEYAPNVQSGTDPSTYDVVGRRAFAQINLKF